MADVVARSRAFVGERYPQGVAAFLGGSSVSGTATPTSDLDILVVLPDRWAGTAFVETVTYEDQLVECFVYGRAGLQLWIDKGRSDRRPVLDRIMGEGLALTESVLTRTLADASRTALGAGPSPLTTDELRLRTYMLSAILDDLADATDPAEQYAVTTIAWREAAELALLVDRHWLGTGKWLVRGLAEAGDRFALAAWAATGDRDRGALLAAGREVLAVAGGYHQAGFTRGVRPADL